MHSITLSFQQKMLISLLIFTENMYFRFFSEYSVCCRKLTVLLCVFADNVHFNSVLSPKTLTTIQKHGVMNTTLSFSPSFWHQRSDILHAFDENGDWYKILNIWMNLKKFKNFRCTVLCLVTIHDYVMQKKGSKQTMKISCMSQRMYRILFINSVSHHWWFFS